MSYSQNDNQNYFTDAGRTTSRVLKAPGGGSSISLGWDTGDAQNVPPQRMNRRQQPELTGKIGQAPVMQQQQAAPNNNGGSYTQGRPQNGYGGGAGSTSSNAYANGSNQNCGNTITDRSSTRIHAPPGGRSSISCLGGGSDYDDRFDAPAPVRQQQQQMQAPVQQVCSERAVRTKTRSERRKRGANDGNEEQ